MTEYQRHKQRKKSVLPILAVLAVVGVLAVVVLAGAAYVVLSKKDVRQALSAQPVPEYESKELCDAFKTGKVKVGDKVKVTGELRSAEEAYRNKLPKLTLDGGIGLLDMVQVVFEEPLPAGLKRGDKVTVSGTVHGPALESHGVLLNNGTFIK